MKRALYLLIGCLLFAPAHANEAAPIKRQVIAFYDSREESTVRLGSTHRFWEMPINHLGYNIRHHDITKPLPELSQNDDVHAILIWFYARMAVPDGDAYMDWLLEAQKLGKKLIVLGDFGLNDKQMAMPSIAEKYHTIMANLGIRDTLQWYSLTYNAELTFQDKEMVGFERDYGVALAPFRSTRALPGASSHLRALAHDGAEPADLVITGPNGGYAASGYFLYIREVEEAVLQAGGEFEEIINWYINPFYFLQKSLNPPFAPVPDVTTLTGRRIYYSHIDGDGWNSLSQIRKYTNERTIAAKVLQEEILEPYSHLPFTVGLITSDIDPNCYGLKDSKQVAKDIFALPNVEPSSHTHSHPFFWRFFADYYPEKEIPYLSKYPPKPKDRTSLAAAATAYFDNPIKHSHGKKTRRKLPSPKLGRMEPTDEEVLKEDFATPRSYACEPFDINREINGSINIINEIVPEGKKAILMQWSGNTSPFEEALAITRESGLLNINGGDSRFDREYPSYAWVAPIGVQIGNERQVYSSNSNENTYTNLWTDRFFGFRYLQSTVENTESPIRVSPFNVYFHVYSAEKQAALTALKDNLDYATEQPLTPIKTSDYVRIAQSFYGVQIIPEGLMRWRIMNRGNLQTFRFDHASQFVVDVENSEGVLGYKHHQNSLYVALDSHAKKPIITLINKDKKETPPSQPYLMESSWPIKSLHKDKNSLTFSAQGFGNGVMKWQAQPTQEYELLIQKGQELLFTTKLTADKQGLIQLGPLDVNALDPVTITLTKQP